MKQEKSNSAVVQGAKQFNDQLKHEEIMKKLDGVRGYQYVIYGGDDDYNDGPYVCWHDGKLPPEDLTEIMNRARHDEIMYMIYRYNNAVDYENQQKGHCPCYFSLPEEIQEMLAKRNNREEIDAYLEKQGFGAKGQDVILKRGDHEEILSYVRRHGLLSEQQKKLLKRNNLEEIEEHIRHHGLCDDLLDGIFKEVQAGNMTAYQNFIDLHELPVKYQKKMLEIADAEMFSHYIHHYGLWEDAHEMLVKTRSDDDIKQYICRHRYLSALAENALVAKRNTELNTLYVECKYNSGSDTRFLVCLLRQRPLDYASITRALLAVKAKRYDSDLYATDAKIMKDGTRKQVLERIAKPERLTIRCLSLLFFRNEPDLFEAYLDTCKCDCFFWN